MGLNVQQWETAEAVATDAIKKLQIVVPRAAADFVRQLKTLFSFVKNWVPSVFKDNFIDQKSTSLCSTFLRFQKILKISKDPLKIIRYLKNLLNFTSLALKFHDFVHINQGLHYPPKWLVIAWYNLKI